MVYRIVSMEPAFQTQPKAKPAASFDCRQPALLQRNSKNAGGDRQNDLAVSAIAHQVLRSPGRPRDAVKCTSFEPPFGYDFSRVRVYADSRAAESVRATSAFAYSWRGALFGQRECTPKTQLGYVAMRDQRSEEGSDDPVHQGMLDIFRSQQGQPAGGMDEQGNQVGPTDAEIKYRPQPIAVLNGPFHAPINEPATVGMEIQITVQSSNGNNAAMALVQDSEQVSPSLDHTGSFAALGPIVGGVSGFMAAVNIPNDRHGIGRGFIINRADNNGGSGSIAFQQLDIYTHPRYAIVNPIAIPNSGYRITQTVTAGPGTRLHLRTEKIPQACTVNGFSTTAGPSAAQHDEVIVRA